MQFIERVLADLIPLFAEAFSGEVSAERALTGLTVFQLASLCVACGGLLSKSADYRLASQLLLFGYFWLLVSLTIALWIVGWLVLHE